MDTLNLKSLAENIPGIKSGDICLMVFVKYPVEHLYKVIGRFLYQHSNLLFLDLLGHTKDPIEGNEINEDCSIYYDKKPLRIFINKENLFMGRCLSEKEIEIFNKIKI